MRPTTRELELIAEIYLEKHQEITWPNRTMPFEEDYHLSELHKLIKSKTYFANYPQTMLARTLVPTALRYLESCNHDCETEAEFDQLVENVCDVIAGEGLIQTAIKNFAIREINELEKFFEVE